MAWKKLNDKGKLEKFVYNGGNGSGRWDYIAIDNGGVQNKTRGGKWYEAQARNNRGPG